MVVTNEAQQRVVDEWNKDNKNVEQLIAFMEGMEAAFELINKIKNDHAKGSASIH